MFVCLCVYVCPSVYLLGRSVGRDLFKRTKNKQRLFVILSTSVWSASVLDDKVPRQRAQLWNPFECSVIVPQAPPRSVFWSLRVLLTQRHICRCYVPNHNMLYGRRRPGFLDQFNNLILLICSRCSTSVWFFVIHCLSFIVCQIKAKYMIPRDPSLKTAYRSAKQIRPRLKIHGIWTYGVSLRIAIIEENQRAGSALICELIALAMEDAFTYCKVKPECLILVGDNTVKELKNKFCLSMLSNYVSHLRLKLLGVLIYTPCLCTLVMDFLQ